MIRHLQILKLIELKVNKPSLGSPKSLNQNVISRHLEIIKEQIAIVLFLLLCSVILSSWSSSFVRNEAKIMKTSTHPAELLVFQSILVLLTISELISPLELTFYRKRNRELSEIGTLRGMVPNASLLQSCGMCNFDLK